MNSSPTAPTSSLLPPIDEDAGLRELLRRCSAETFRAAREFRRTGGIEHLAGVVDGVIERFVARDLRFKLRHPKADLRLVDDLGLDSLSLMEIVTVIEDVVRVSIDNDQLRGLRTLGDIHRFVERQVAGS